MRRYEHPRTRNEFLATIASEEDWGARFDENGNAILTVGESGENEIFVVNPMKTHRKTEVIRRDASDPGEAFPAVVRKIAMKRDGEKRHASRVAAAEWALIVAFMGQDDEDDCHWSSDEDQRELLRAIAEFEVHGTGGPEGFQGGATDRMAWARGLGKGRKNASDGEVWDSAIGSVFEGGVMGFGEPHYRATPEVAMTALGLLTDGLDPLFAACYAIDRAMSTAAEEAHDWVRVFEAAAAKVTDEFAPFDRVWWSFPRRGDGSDPLETMETVDYQPDECIPVSDSPGPKVEILSRRPNCTLAQD